MSTESPKPENEESLFERAMRQAKDAGAQAPTNAGRENVDLLAAAGVTGVGSVAQALGPGQYRFRTARRDAIGVFVKELRGLEDQNTRLEVASGGAGQTTSAYFKQLGKSGWDTAVTVTFLQSTDGFVTVNQSGQSLAHSASSLADIGGTVADMAGSLLSRRSIFDIPAQAGRVMEGLGDVARKANDLTLNNQIKGIVERVGATLEEEERRAERVQDEQRIEQAAFETCPFCATPYRPLAELTTDQWERCLACGSPRKIEPDEKARAEAELQRRNSEKG